MSKDSTPISDKRLAMSSTVVGMKKITELPKNSNWKYDAEHVKKCIQHILDICTKNGLIPTVNMMAMALGISKMTEYNVRTGVTAANADVVDLLNEYVRICENVMLQGTFDGTINNIGGIFGLKSLYGYRDEPKEIVVTHQFNGLLGERRDPEAIAQRYAEAVVIDVEPDEIKAVEASDGDESDES